MSFSFCKFKFVDICCINYFVSPATSLVTFTTLFPPLALQFWHHDITQSLNTIRVGDKSYPTLTALVTTTRSIYYMLLEGADIHQRRKVLIAHTLLSTSIVMALNEQQINTKYHNSFRLLTWVIYFINKVYLNIWTCCTIIFNEVNNIMPSPIWPL